MSRFIGKTEKMINECLVSMVNSNKDLNILFPVITLQRGNMLRNKILVVLNKLRIKWITHGKVIEVYINNNIHKIQFNTVGINGCNIRGQYYDSVNIKVDEIEYFDYVLLLQLRNPTIEENYINVYED